MRLTLNGQVVADDDLWMYNWFEIPAFSPAVVREALNNVPAGEALEIEINSVGGSVFAGFEIFSLLREAKCETVAIIQSLAASAASTIVSGCKTVLMSPVAQLMLHLPLMQTYGNQEDHKQSIKVLKSITESIINGYVAKAGGHATREHFEKLIREESWLTAQEAMDIGIADKILWDEEEIPPAVAGLVNSVGSGLRGVAGTGYLSRDELFARYQTAVANGAAPAEGHPVAASTTTPAAPAAENNEDWQFAVALEKEKCKGVFNYA